MIRIAFWMIRSFYVRMSTGSSAISPTTKGNISP